MTADQATAIITRVMGQAPRSSDYGLAGARDLSPYACVDDGKFHYHVYGKTAEEALLRLVETCSREYPAATQRAMADLDLGSFQMAAE